MGVRHPAIITSDGFIDPETIGDLTIHPDYGAHTLPAHMVVLLRNDYEEGRVRDLVQEGMLDVIGKSGHSRVMMTIDQRKGESINFDSSRRIIVPINISSVRSVEVRREDVRDDLLQVLKSVVQERRRSVLIGRLALASPEQALSKEDIEKALGNNRLWLPPHCEISEEGEIELPLEDVRYLFCEANFDEDGMRRAIRFGKHGLDGLQVLERGLPSEIRGRQALVTGSRLSIGPFTGIIQQETTKPDVIHLAARILDGIRTTGIDVMRQIELFNRSLNSISTENLRVRMKLYHTAKEAQRVADDVISHRTLREGVNFSDVINMQEHPERLSGLMEHIGPTSHSGKPYGYLVGPGRSRELPWEAHPTFQASHLPKVNAKFASSDPDYCVSGGGCSLLCTRSFFSSLVRRT